MDRNSSPQKRNSLRHIQINKHYSSELAQSLPGVGWTQPMTHWPHLSQVVWGDFHTALLTLLSLGCSISLSSLLVGSSNYWMFTLMNVRVFFQPVSPACVVDFSLSWPPRSIASFNKTCHDLHNLQETALRYLKSIRENIQVLVFLKWTGMVCPSLSLPHTLALSLTLSSPRYRGKEKVETDDSRHRSNKLSIKRYIVDTLCILFSGTQSAVCFVIICFIFLEKNLNKICC